MLSQELLAITIFTEDKKVLNYHWENLPDVQKDAYRRAAAAAITALTGTSSSALVKPLPHLTTTVQDRQGYLVSLHQHPDGALRFIAATGREDFTAVDLRPGTSVVLFK